ncbi:MAG: hypothetical protein B6I23_01425 [Rickettsiaceae bacterium 4572_127]|nr:MAG: hypothetical protein B6I23_01425 [Rickettsiaceae bacterium 4572_127]
MKKRIGILCAGFIDWNGGLEFLKKTIIQPLLHGNKIYDNIEFYIIVPHVKKDIKVPFLIKRIGFLRKKYKKIKQSTISKKRNTSFDKYKKEAKIVFSDDLSKCVKKYKLDLLFPSIGILGKNFNSKWVGYLYDCQHKYYPQFFDKKEINARNSYFQRMVDNSDKFIVNSTDTKNDFIKFYKAKKSQVVNLPFAPLLNKEWLEKKPDLLKKYSLPKKYFIISNQFWIHKGHNTAFEALAKLKNKDIHIVCTGKMEDARDKNHINKLKTKIEKLGITNKIHFLGFIPKRDQIEILKNSLSIIQPTLFEGGPGGGSIYDGVSLGLPCIISDLKVNKEVTGKNLFFFKVKSSTDLAKKMSDFLNKKITKPTKTKILKQNKVFLERLSKTLYEIIQEKK